MDCLIYQILTEEQKNEFEKNIANKLKKLYVLQRNSSNFANIAKKKTLRWRSFEKETSGQTRTGTPKEAKDGGASYIVLGRTVTEAKNPNEVLVKIKGSL